MRCYLFTSSSFFVAIIAVSLLANYALVAAGDSSKVNVGVYYESLCGDSMRWIKEKLVPSYDALKDYINVTFVPYGKATHFQNSVTGQWQFSCQHGPAECEGNMAQACGIYAIQNGEPAEKVQQFSVALVGCAMSAAYPPTSVPQCASKIELKDETQNAIDKCINGSLAKTLLAANGDRTIALSPPITFVPTITINGVTSKEIQQQALGDFLKLICDTLAEQPKPSQCGSA